MSKKITEISAINFSAAVEYAYNLNKKMHFNIQALKIVLPLGSIILALLSILHFLGILYFSVYNKPERLIAFNSLPIIQKYWNGIWGMLSNITDLLYLKIILMIVFLLFVPFLFCSIVALIIYLSTKGEPPIIEGSTAQKAKKLYTYLDKSPKTYTDLFEGKLALWRRICGIVSGLCVIVFTLYLNGSTINQSNDFTSAIAVLFKSDKHTEDILICIIIGVFLYIGYSILHIIFTVMIQPYYDSHKKWKRITEAAKHYWVSVDNEERKRRDDKEKSESYDGWKYKNIGKSLYYQSKKEEYYAQYMGLDYETDEDNAKRIVRDIEDDLSGGGYGDY